MEGNLSDVGHGFPPSCLLPVGWELPPTTGCDAGKGNAREAVANVFLLGFTPNHFKSIWCYFCSLGYL